MKVFYLTLAISLLLIIGGFLLPPMGVIDGSVLTAVGELLMFGVLAQLPHLIEATKNGKSVKISKGDFSISTSSSESASSEATASASISPSASPSFSGFPDPESAS